MPNFIKRDWNGYRFCLKSTKSDIRSWLFIIPYYWDNEISFDLAIRLIGQANHDDLLNYIWELRDLDDHILKEGQDEVRIIKDKLRAYYKSWPMGKERAITLGNLETNRHYCVYIKLLDANNNESEFMQVATFTTKDRDEVLMQLFILIIGICFSLYFGFLARGC